MGGRRRSLLSTIICVNKNGSRPSNSKRRKCSPTPEMPIIDENQAASASLCGSSDEDDEPKKALAYDNSSTRMYTSKRQVATLFRSSILT